ncbi:unnamed protein product [Somion occarium]|uniref:MYND-type domain-containing protein n=1 Tax=Somion occarium TaxID=3059160 RepID=A0ABP1DXG4_9APHY
MAEPVGMFFDLPGGRREYRPWLGTIFTTPTAVASTLSKFHQEDNVEDKFAFADDLHFFLFYNHLRPYFDSFLTSGLSDVLVNILCDPRSYEFVGSILFSLDVIATSFIERAESGQDVDLIRRRLEHICNSWPALWKMRDFLWNPDNRFRAHGEVRSDTLEARLTRYIIHVSFVTNLVYRELHKAGHYAHIVLYAWVHAKDDLASEQCGKAAAHLIGRDPDGLKIIREAIVDTNCVPQLTNAIQEALLSPRIINLTLRDLFYFLIPANLCCSSLIHERAQSTDTMALLEASCLACQRQLCQGMPELDYDILVPGFIEIGSLLQSPSSPHAEAVMRKVKKLKVLPMLASIFPRAMARNNKNCLDAMCYPLEAYGTTGQLFIRRDPDSQFIKDLTSIARTIWFPTLKEIRALHVLPASPLYEYLEVWLNFGKRLGFKESTEARLYGSYMSSRPPENHLHRRCNWENCLCKEPGLFKHSWHVCKGCWVVSYCSRRCQKRDWEDGDHRSKCRGRR